MAVMEKGPPEAVADATESDVLLLTQIAPTLVEAANAVNVLAVVICTGLLEDPIAPKILRFRALAEMP
jgi:hydrogenase-4 membrane subunit HyfE